MSTADTLLKLTPTHIIGTVLGKSDEHSHTSDLAVFSIGFSGSSSTTYANRFMALQGTLLFSSTEATVQATIPYHMVLKRLIVKLGVNSVDGNTVIALRDDGVDMSGSVLTFVAGSTTEQVTDELNTIIEADSKVNWRVDTSASGSGNWLISHALAFVKISI